MHTSDVERDKVDEDCDQGTEDLWDEHHEDYEQGIEDLWDDHVEDGGAGVAQGVCLLGK
jgi:hypothetical protein